MLYETKNDVLKLVKEKTSALSSSGSLMFWRY